VPEEAIWAFEPGAHFGVHRIDEFYFETPFEQVSE
jgi:peptide/nickel transport system substrate-binding protein